MLIELEDLKRKSLKSQMFLKYKLEVYENVLVYFYL